MIDMKSSKILSAFKKKMLVLSCIVYIEFTVSLKIQIKVEYNANVKYENLLSKIWKTSCVGQRLIHPIIEKR